MKSIKLLLVTLLIIATGSITTYFNYRITPLKLAKQSKEELMDYIQAFPMDEYKVCRIPELGGSFYVDDIPDSIKGYLKQELYFEEDIGDLIDVYAKKDSIAIDLGAHIGIHTLRMSRSVGDKGQVIAFEPQRKIFRELVLNMCLNECKNVLLLRNAIGEERKLAQMTFRQAQDEGSASIGVGGDDVEMVTLDSLHLDNVSLIKMDIEFYEDKALQGARKTILRNKPVIIFEVMGNYDYHNCPAEVKERFDYTLNFVKNLGYSVELIYGNDYLARPLPTS